jgi:hypothetical protein
VPKRWCICKGCPACGTGCGNLFDLDTTRSQRCPGCQHHRTRQLQQRPSSSSRGLGWAFTRRKHNDTSYQQATRCQCPGCPRCGTGCGQPFTTANPKTAGHVQPRSKGGGSSPIRAVCRACNSSDGGRLAHNA